LAGAPFPVYWLAEPRITLERDRRVFGSKMLKI